MHNWLLPEYLEDILPHDAARIEKLRRALLDLFQAHGYQLVIPPLLEYLPSLLTGTGHDMDLKTFKLVDQLSGRLMGLRADITPQMARIDAHLLNRQGVVRLCYAGDVLHTLPYGLAKTRGPLQIGAELFGHAGPEADLEIQQLMIKGLALAGIQAIHLDLGHVWIFGSVVENAALAPELEAELFGVLQSKDAGALNALTAKLPAVTRDALLLLPELYGGNAILKLAREKLPPYPRLIRALDELDWVAKQLQSSVQNISYDLAELRGYHYHSGIVFSAYANGMAEAVAQGGRYDEVGEAFGRARPATGFSMELRGLSEILPRQAARSSIFAPYNTDSALQEKIDSLRSQGEIVISDLPGHEETRSELQCDRQLVLQNGVWVVIKNN